MYKIEKGIKIDRLSRGFPIEYDFMRKMEQWDSFFVTTWKEVSHLMYHSYKLRPEKNFSYRKQDGGFRIWRVE